MGEVAKMMSKFKTFSWFYPEPLLAVMLWGGIYPAIKIGLQDIPPISFTGMRIFLAAVLLFVISRKSRPLVVSRPLILLAFRAGFSFSAFQLVLIYSLQWTSAGVCAILLATTPLISAGWLAISGRDRLRGRQWCGMLLGLAGVVLLVKSGPVVSSWFQVVGNLLALGAAAMWVWYSVEIEPLVKSIGTVAATGWAMGIAALFFAPLTFWEASSISWEAISWESWAGLVYGGTAGMVVAMALWSRALRRWGMYQAMIYIYLEPVFAVLLSMLILGESLYLEQAGGAVLTIAGVALASMPLENRVYRDT